MTIYNEPCPWPGTREEERANRKSHDYVYEGGPDDGDVRCMNCDVRPSYVSAGWPCRATVPRRYGCVACNRGIKHEHTPEEAALLRNDAASATE